MNLRWNLKKHKQQHKPPPLGVQTPGRWTINMNDTWQSIKQRLATEMARWGGEHRWRWAWRWIDSGCVNGAEGQGNQACAHLANKEPYWVPTESEQAGWMEPWRLANRQARGEDGREHGTERAHRPYRSAQQRGARRRRGMQLALLRL